MDQLLAEWGFPELADTFAEHEIDEEALRSLDENTVKEFLPKIGPRIKFLTKLREYQSFMNIPIELHADDNQQLNQSFSSTPSTSSASTENVEIAEAFQESTKRELSFSSLNDFKRACRNVYHLDLETFLSKTVSGKYILNFYKKEKKLTRSTRNQLSYILLSGLMSENCETLIPLDFEILSEKICALFPNEIKSTYYIPRVPATKSSKPINAKGKLIDKYRNLRRSYNLTGKTDDGKHSDDTDTTSLESIPDLDDSEERVKWLKSHQEPWDLVEENWKKTFNLRQATSCNTVESFIEKWPILKHKNAHSLIDLDFQRMFPNCVIPSLLKEYQKWDQFFENLKKTCSLDKNTEEFITPIYGDISQDARNAIQIAALPMIFPPKTRIRCKKIHWKPSIVECQESIINLVPTCAQIEEVILKRIKKLADLGLSVQPFIIVVGTLFSSITDTYLVIDQHIYKTCSVLETLDFLFKTFHALNAQYPKESEHIWLSIERALFKIESSDIKIPTVLTLLKDLESI